MRRATSCTNSWPNSPSKEVVELGLTECTDAIAPLTGGER